MSSDVTIDNPTRSTPASSATTPPAPRVASARRVTAILAMTGMAVSIMQTLVIPILPSLPTILHTHPANSTWVLTMTLLVGAVFTPISGRLGDMFGKRRILLVSVAMMVLGSAMCALSDSLAPMLVGRAMQGMSIGSVALGISLMRDTLPRERLASAVALMSATMGIGGAIGLPLSAAVAEKLSWHYLFWGSTVIGVLAMIGIARTIPESTIKTGGRFDVVGAAGLSIALVSLLFGLSKSTDWGWGDPRQLALFAVALLVFAFWARYEMRAKNPLVNIQTSIRKVVLFTNLASILVGFAMYTLNLVMTQLLQAPDGTGLGFGQSMIVAGLCSAPMGIAMMLVSPVAARIITRFGPRFALCLGPVVIASGFLYAAFFLHHVWEALIVAAVTGVGIAIAYAAMPTIIMRSVPTTETAAANSVNTLSRSLGTSLAAAVHGAIIATALAGSISHPEAMHHDSFTAFDLCFVLGAISCVLAVAIASLIPRPQAPVVPVVEPDLPADIVDAAGITDTGDVPAAAGDRAGNRAVVLIRRARRRSVVRRRPAARPRAGSGRR